MRRDDRESSSEVFLIQFLILIYYRIAEIDAQFADLQVNEQQWPLPGPDVMPMYKKYLTHTYKLDQNIVCAGLRHVPISLYIQTSVAK